MALDRPFTGTTAISPGTFQRSLELYSKLTSSIARSVVWLPRQVWPLHVPTTAPLRRPASVPTRVRGLRKLIVAEPEAEADHLLRIGLACDSVSLRVDGRLAPEKRVTAMCQK